MGESLDRDFPRAERPCVCWHFGLLGGDINGGKQDKRGREWGRNEFSHLLSSYHLPTSCSLITTCPLTCTITFRLRAAIGTKIATSYANFLTGSLEEDFLNSEDSKPKFDKIRERKVKTFTRNWRDHCRTGTRKHMETVQNILIQFPCVFVCLSYSDLFYFW